MLITLAPSPLRRSVNSFQVLPKEEVLNSSWVPDSFFGPDSSAGFIELE
jgi:hypothetical protein